MNNHHWQTKWVWLHFVPSLFKDLGLPFDPAAFKAVPKMWKGFNFSYHEFAGAAGYLYSDLQAGTEKSIDSPDQMLDPSYPNPYHQRFLGFHRVCRLDNKTPGSGRRLMVNCDSMSVPLIPLLAPFFDSMLVLDNRTTRSFKPGIDGFKPTHYLALGLVRNFIQYRKQDIEKIKKNLFFIIDNKIFRHNIQ